MKNKIKQITAVLLVAVMLFTTVLLPSPVKAEALSSSGNIGVHDPSIVIDPHNTNNWWVFATGSGVSTLKSTDAGKTWASGGKVFSSAQSWWKTYAPNMGNNDVWAADLKYYNGKWYMYYSVSVFAKNTSAIGLATLDVGDTGLLSNSGWVDQGLVISSTTTDNYNCIDANLVFDKNDEPWLTFGSFWSGIQLVKLDKTTMKPAAGATVKNIAQKVLDNTGNPILDNQIEAPYIIYENGYYYLFTSIKFCCKGSNSNYETQCGRSTNIDGPYVDRTGKPMLESGGNIINVGGPRWVGPGGQSLAKDGDKWILARHGYDYTANGASKLLLNYLYFDKDGWPTLSLEDSTLSVNTSGGAVSLLVGNTLQMVSTSAPTANQPVFWQVFNEDGTKTTKATITPTGVIKGVSDGKVKVVATLSEKPDVSSSMILTIYANKTALEQQIDAGKNAVRANYTDILWTQLQSALSAAQLVDQNTNATQSEVDTAANNLKNAINSAITKMTTPKVWYKFDDGNGAVATDASGNSFNGTLNGGAAYVTPGAMTVASSGAIEYGNSGDTYNPVFLDGVQGSNIKIADNILSNVKDSCISIWVNFANFTKHSRIFEFYKSSGWAFMDSMTDGSGNTSSIFRYTIYTGGADHSITTTAKINAGEWTNIIINQKGSTCNMYFNGTLVGTTDMGTVSLSTLGNTTANYIGKSNWNDPVPTALFDDFRLYDRSLNSDEIANISAKKPLLVDLKNAATQTNAGVAPVLPSKVTANMEDGTTTEIPVQWDVINPASYAAAGTFTISGTATLGTASLVAKANITVTGTDPSAKAFTIVSNGVLERTGGITATISVNPNSGVTHNGTETVIFELMKGSTPISIIGINRDITSQDQFNAYFNVDPNDKTYTVKAFVLDQFSSSPTNAPISLADSAELK